MVAAVFDTSILIDHLRGLDEAREELARYRKPEISIITWMEVLVGSSEQQEKQTRHFLQKFVVVPMDDEVTERAVRLRRLHRVKLPDAIIWATAQIHALPLVTRNTRDFSADDAGIRIPYTIT